MSERVRHLEIEKISSKKVSERVEEQMEIFIRNGTFKPGEKLPSVRELCDQFEVGRSAVRDALTSLKGKGLVEIRHGEGTFVCSFDPSKWLQQYLLLPNVKDLEALFQVREMLETGMVELAAQHRTESDLEKMELAIEDMKTMNEDKNGLSDHSFHMAICKASGNHILFQLMDFISSTTKKSMLNFHGYIASDEKLVKEIIRQHECIFEAIQNEEGVKAKEAISVHLAFVRNLMRECRREIMIEG